MNRILFVLMLLALSAQTQAQTYQHLTSSLKKYVFYN